MTQHQQHHSGNNSFSIYHSNKRCDFCMYHDLIFDQLQRLKQAVMMKNERIKELEDFISKMSEMAFMRNPTVASLGSVNSMLIPKSTEMIEQQSSSLFLNSPNDSKNFMFKKKPEEQSEISFQDMRLNTAKFEGKHKQSTDFMSRFERIKELNEIKRELDRQISETADKENMTVSQRAQSYHSSSCQFDTIRTLSQPQQQGRIGCIGHESSRLSEFQQKKPRFQKMNDFISNERNKLTNTTLKKSSSFEDKSSINIIKNSIKILQ